LGSFEQTLWQLSPYLTLLLTGGILLGLDALRSRWDASRWTPYVALAGLAGALVATVTLWGCNEGLLGVLSCDDFALTVNAIVLAAMALVTLISSEGMRVQDDHHPGMFYALLLLAALALCLLGAVTDLVMFFLASEIFGIASFATIGYPHGDRRAGEAMVKYLVLSVAMSAMMLYGLSWAFGLAGSTDLLAISKALSQADSSLHLMLLSPMILVAVGFVGKVAAVPFHQWLPDVVEGTPDSVVAFFAVIPALTGLVGLARVALVMLPVDVQALDVDLGTLLSAVAVLTMLIGSLVALWQQNVKRFLAYLGISQMGYLLVGFVVYFGIAQANTSDAEVEAICQQSVIAVLYGLTAYALSMLGVLAAALVLSRHTGSFDIKSYAGMHRRSPELAWPMILCLLSLVGFPPAGFVGRLYLFSAAVEAGLLWLVIVGAVNSVVLLACAWKIARVLFVAPPAAPLPGTMPSPPDPAETETHLTVSPVLAVVLGACVTGLLAMTVFANPILTLLQAAAQALFG
jgi:proton-translocating NADH-quinone oxidoreductase chain N